MIKDERPHFWKEGRSSFFVDFRQHSCLWEVVRWIYKPARHQLDPEVNVRSGRVAGAAAFSDLLSPTHNLPIVDQEGGIVPIVS